ACRAGDALSCCGLAERTTLRDLADPKDAVQPRLAGAAHATTSGSAQLAAMVPMRSQAWSYGVRSSTRWRRKSVMAGLAARPTSAAAFVPDTYAPTSTRS